MTNCWRWPAPAGRRPPPRDRTRLRHRAPGRGRHSPVHADGRRPAPRHRLRPHPARGIIPRYKYAERYHVGPAGGHKALKVLERESLAWSQDYIHYAAPTGPPDPGPPAGTPRDLDAEAAAIGGLIAARLAAGEWPPGTVLPPQQTLANDYATQPTLISLALRRLAGQDKLTPVPLSGRRFAYLVPDRDHPAPRIRTLAAVILLWDDGTRTRLDTKGP